MALTEQGGRLASEVATSLEALTSAFERLSSTGTGRQNLRVSASPTFASNWLVPRLGAFHAAFPDIAVDVEATGELADIEGGAADVAIRHLKSPSPGPAARHVNRLSAGPAVQRLLPIVLAPLCAPLLVTGQALPLAEDRLAQMPLLQPVDLSGLWFVHRGRPDLLQALTIRATHRQDHTTIQAAIAGQGLAFVNPLFCLEALDTGRLVQLSPAITVPDDSGYWLLASRRANTRRPVAAFGAWIVQQLTMERTSGDGPRPGRLQLTVDAPGYSTKQEISPSSSSVRASPPSVPVVSKAESS